MCKQALDGRRSYDPSQAAGLSKALMTDVSKRTMNASETHYRALPIHEFTTRYPKPVLETVWRRIKHPTETTKGIIMAQLVYMKEDNSNEEGVVIDTEDSTDEQLEKEYYPMKVIEKVRLPEDCDMMPCDRLLQAV